jgi:TonB family protein
MTVLSWLIESAVRLALLTAAVAALLTVLRVTAADVRLRVWSFVLVAAMALPFVPTLWAVPIPVSGGEAAGRLMSSTIAVSQTVAPSATAFPISPSEGLIVVYGAGVLILLLRLVIGRVWSRRLRASAHVVPGQPFLESALVHVPVTVGLLRPAIILPETWRSWPADTLAAVVAHEHAHASRRDGLWATLALLHRAIHWINPLSWWLARHLVSLSERASDDAALGRGIAPTRYAEILLGFATLISTGHPRVAWIVPMARPSGRDTERRLDRVLTWKGRPAMTRFRLAILVLLLAAGSAGVYTASLVTEVKTPPIPTKTVFFPATPPPASTPAQASAPSPRQSPAPRAAEPVSTPVSNTNVPTAQKADPVVVMPVATKRVDPKYTPEAMRAKIQGKVTLLASIDEKGVVTAAKVAESLDAEHGLDSNAIDALMGWTFLPGTVDGVAKAFEVKVTMEFRLH